VTNEITSYSKTASLVKDGDYWVLYYVYETEPNALYSENNPIQKGAVWLEIEKTKSNLKTWLFPAKAPVLQLKGHYWTSRKTIGDLQFWKET
jgi:hypothetical protein